MVRVLAESRENSVRKLSKLTGIAKSTSHDILNHDLQLPPSRLKLVQLLCEEDYVYRVFACEELLQQASCVNEDLRFSRMRAIPILMDM